MSSKGAAAAATATLVRWFARRRPLRAGSLLVTVFGDAIAPRGGAVTLESLIGLAEPFGLKERLVRTATARLAGEGWLETRRLGKRSEYRLTASGRERFAAATERIYGPAPAWSGRWTLLLVPPATRRRAAQRRAVQRELTWLGFGEIAAGLFAHPLLDRAGLARALEPLDLARTSLAFDATLLSEAEARRLVERGWDLTELARGYERFLARFAPARGAAAQADPRSAFVLRTLLIHEYRRLHLRDPLLPTELLPPAWPGLAAALLCRALYAALLPGSEDFVAATARRLEGPLPAADAGLYRRFALEDDAVLTTTARAARRDRS